MAQSLTDFFKGDGKIVQFTVKLNGVAKDITDDTVKFFLYNNETDDDENAVLSKECVHYDASNGITILTLTKDDTSITRKKYWYKVKVFDSEDTPSTVMSDEIRCK